MMRRAVLAASLIAIVAGRAPAVAGTYVNERYGFSLTFPNDQIKPEPDDSANGDGRRFHGSGGGDVVVAAFAYARLEERPPAQIAAEAQQDCAGTPPTYRLVRRDLVALSCIHAGVVYYQKSILNADFETTLQAHYPVRDKARWDPVIARMAKSLRGATP